jgi:uncharacterized protein YjbI with pentapeptide repeats
LQGERSKTLRNGARRRRFVFGSIHQLKMMTELETTTKQRAPMAKRRFSQELFSALARQSPAFVADRGTSKRSGFLSDLMTALAGGRRLNRDECKVSIVADEVSTSPKPAFQRKLNLSGVDFTGSLLVGVDFTEAVLTSAKMGGVDLTEAVLTSAKMGGVDLTEAVLTRCRFIGSDLSNAFLTRAHLNYASLVGADLSYANLIGAVLSNAQLTNSCLIGADLSDAVIGEWNLLLLGGLRWATTTQWPNDVMERNMRAVSTEIEKGIFRVRTGSGGPRGGGQPKRHSVQVRQSKGDSDKKAA